MAVDFKNKIDEREDIVEGDDSLNFQLFLYDDEYEELLERTDSEIDFDYAMEETDATFAVTANVYKGGEVELLLEIQSEDIGWSDYEISVSDEEKEALLNEAERVVQEKCGMSVDEYIDELFAVEEEQEAEYDD